MRIGLIFEKLLREIAIIDLKKYVASAYILNVIVYKLSYKQEFNPVIFILINNNWEVCFYYAVLSLVLFVEFEVEDCGKLLFNANKVAERGPGLWSENWVLITDY